MKTDDGPFASKGEWQQGVGSTGKSELEAAVSLTGQEAIVTLHMISSRPKAIRLFSTCHTRPEYRLRQTRIGLLAVCRATVRLITVIYVCKVADQQIVWPAA